ncbi:FKBP-type peptidyl-prolyl cis-trans isomerase [Rhodohalobacter sulfatireducens]|uniref:Peptidyl-prolyl cis-trans isomerase n=1 Tax=Rhodohalobacter sulfatireducens TaxID=2911366 RepID=A0ABS9KD33_9BACT|nr:peptidylprolyl isomerase [Rhodohalobacter sulfatireducens]MCG2588769.1 peptidylprolyl isomerase [Rhodohalobacter sulfatireducens]MDR9410872.1 peptidylprolyl isomerase [Balneolaceae bacterium]
MSKAKDGDTVKVHYTGTLENGEVFDTSQEREPLEFQLGQGQLIPGFEKAVIGLSEGDSTKVDIPSDEAYGEVRDDLVINVPKEQLPDDVEPKVGMQLQVNQQNGQPIPVRITEIKDEELILDANHPLAGKNLTFEIELLEVA